MSCLSCHSMHSLQANSFSPQGERQRAQEFDYEEALHDRYEAVRIHVAKYVPLHVVSPKDIANKGKNYVGDDHNHAAPTKRRSDFSGVGGLLSKRYNGGMDREEEC